MVKRLVFVVLSGLALAAVARLAAQGAATLQARSSSAASKLLLVGAEQLSDALEEAGHDLPTLATQFPADAADVNATQDFKALVVAVNFGEAGRTPPPAVQARIEQLTAKARDRMAAYRAAHPQVDATALVTEAGVVLLSETELFRVGENLAPGRAAQLAAKRFAAEVAAAEEEGARPPSPPPQAAPQEKGLLDDVLSGATARGTKIKDGVLHAWGAAPITLKGKIVGALVVTRRLRTLPEVSGLEAFLTVDDRVILGKAPAGFTPEVDATREPVLLAPRAAFGKLFGATEVPVPPLFTPPERIGVFGFAKAVDGVPGAKVFVANDVTPLYVELASWQVTVLFATAVAWLIHAVFFMLAGRSVLRGVHRMADFLGRLQQGLATERLLNERQLPRELVRLARLVNKTLEQSGSGLATVTPLAKSPTLDEVLQAQAVEPPADVGDLEFEGITNAGTLTAAAEPPVSLGSSRASAPPPPPPVDAVPEAPVRRTDDGHVIVPQRTASVVSGEATAVFLASRRGTIEIDALEEDTDPMVATAPSSVYDGLEEDALPAPPPAPAKPVLAPPPPGASTTVMQMPPELLAQLKAMAGEVDEQSAHPTVVPEPTPPPAPAPAAPAASASADEAHYREVYESFVNTRRTCGELGELGYEKFKTRLLESRAAVVAKHNCKEVRFQVYVKNGKAALKATPING